MKDDSAAFSPHVQVAAFLPRSLVNGPGVRTVLWVQGCPFACPGCCNPDFRPVAGGRSMSLTEAARLLLDESDIEGITFSGGEPFSQAAALAELAAQAQDIGGIKVLAARLEGFDAKALRDAMDRLKQQLGDAVVVLAGTEGGKAALVAGVSGAALGRIKAGDVLGEVARQINGKGGGRPDMAQGGGEDGPALVAALESVPVRVRECLQP